MSKEILQTDRLCIAELEPCDAAFMHQLMNEPEWIRFVGDRNIRTIEDAQTYITEKIRVSYAEFGFGFYKVSLKNTNVSLGICGFVKRPSLAYPDIGFGFLTQYTRKGYAFEASQALLAYGKNKLQFSTIFAFTDPENKASIKLIKYLGMTFVEEIEEEEYGTSLLFSLVRV